MLLISLKGGKLLKTKINKNYVKHNLILYTTIDITH